MSTAVSVASSSRSARSRERYPRVRLPDPRGDVDLGRPHKYGYASKGSSVSASAPRNCAMRNNSRPDRWSGEATSPGMEGSTVRRTDRRHWAAMVSWATRAIWTMPGRFSRRRSPCRMPCEPPELRMMGHLTFLFSFTSDAFDIYHVNDFMRNHGWRLNGQQYPDALHMAVTRPQTRSDVADDVCRRPVRRRGLRQGARGGGSRSPGRSTAAWPAG